MAKIISFIKTPLFWMLVVLISIFASCKTAQQQSEKHLGIALKKDKAYVIDTLRKIAPCIVTSADTSKPITTIITNTISDTIRKDSIIYVKCDSVGIKEVKCPQYYITKKITDSIFSNTTITIRIKDVADSLTESIRANVNAAEAKKQSGKKEFWMYWAIIATILSLLLVIFIVIKSKTKTIQQVANGTN